jgi:hypothetical protein
VLRFFNSNSLGVFILLVLIPLIYWIPDFIEPVSLPAQAFAGTLPALWIQSFVAQYSILSMIVALLIILVNAFLLIQLNTIHIFIAVRTPLPALFYIIIAAGINPVHQLTPALVSSLLVIFILFRLFITYRYDGPSANFLDTGFLLSVASMIYFPVLIIVIMVVVGLVILRPVEWREWAYLLIGLALPYAFLFTGFYVADLPLSGFFPGFSGLFTYPHQAFSIMQLIGWLIVVGMMVYASIFMYAAIDNMKIHGRKIFILLLWLFLIAAGIYAALPGSTTDLVTIAAIPLAYLLTHYFSSCTRNWINESLLAVFFVLMVLLWFL